MIEGIIDYNQEEIKQLERELILLVFLKVACPLKPKDSLIKSLNGFNSYLKIEKSSNKPTRLKNKQRSLTVNFLLLLTRLPVKADRLKCSPDITLRWRSVLL